MNTHKLISSLEKVAEKVQCQDDVKQTTKTIELANRLVKGFEVRRICLNMQPSVSFKIFEIFFDYEVKLNFLRIMCRENRLEGGTSNKIILIRKKFK